MNTVTAYEFIMENSERQSTPKGILGISWWKKFQGSIYSLLINRFHVKRKMLKKISAKQQRVAVVLNCLDIRDKNIVFHTKQLAKDKHGGKTHTLLSKEEIFNMVLFCSFMIFSVFIVFCSLLQWFFISVFHKRPVFPIHRVGFCCYCFVFLYFFFFLFSCFNLIIIN